MVQSIVDFLLLIFWGLKHEILPVTGNQTKDQILRNEQYPFFQTVQFRALIYRMYKKSLHLENIL